MDYLSVMSNYLRVESLEQRDLMSVIVVVVVFRDSVHC